MTNPTVSALHALFTFVLARFGKVDEKQCKIRPFPKSGRIPFRKTPKYLKSLKLWQSCLRVD
jgi:hypothetical protein